MDELNQAMAAQSTALEAKKMEAKAFFKHVISPLVEKTDGAELLEELMVSKIEDEMKRKSRSIVPEEVIRTPVSSVEEVTQAILTAKREKKILRVVGSAHSVSDAIFPRDGVTLLLTGDLRKVEINEEKEEDGKKWLYCRIGAGCYLGVNSLDPYRSDLQNSACYQLALKGYGFPELGGIIHQSIGGFISTGSAGGSLKHSFADVIQEIEFVDGTGMKHTAKPGEEEWCAVGVSMGLFGVITHVSFRLPEMSLVEGSESNYNFAESVLGPDEMGKSKLEKSLEENEYIRVNWFPQKGVRRVQQWVAQQHPTVGYIIPYHSILSTDLASGMAAIVLKLCNCLLQKPNPTEIHYYLIGLLLRPFVNLGPPTAFCDMWYNALPMDNEVPTDSIMKMDFTEIWIPLEECQDVMDKLQKLFEDQQACGNLATEIYGAKETPFWLSMSYNQKMVRVDPYWWAYNEGDKRNFFSYFWDALLEIPGSRLHWGKYLPLPGQKCGNITFNLTYLKSVYPKMDDWLKKREEMDPDQVFVTDYWRRILEIPAPSQ